MRIDDLLDFLKSEESDEKKLLIEAIENVAHISGPTQPEVHQKSLAVAIQELKKQNFYHSLNLSERLIFLKIIVNQVFYCDVLEYALTHLPNAEFEEEKKILKRRTEVLKIVNILTNIEKAVVAFSQFESKSSETKTLNVTHPSNKTYLREITELKQIILSNRITFNQIKSFFNLKLFDLILEAATKTSFLPFIYMLMLEDTLIVQQTDLNQHLELLLGKKSEKKRDFNYEFFRKILYSKTNIPKPSSTRYSITPEGTLIHNKRKNIPSPLITEPANDPETKKLRFN